MFQDIIGNGIVLLWAERHNSHLCHKFPQPHPHFYFHLLNPPQVHSSYIYHHLSINYSCNIMLWCISSSYWPWIRIETRPGKIKILGALLCLGGALIIALYKGISFHLTHHHQQNNVVIKTHHNLTRGTLFLIGSCFFYAVWYILQVN